MSRVYFHSPSEPDAELLGRERMWGDSLTRKLALAALAALGVDSVHLRERIEPALPPEARATLRDEHWENDFRLWWGWGDFSGAHHFAIDGHTLDPWHVTLNTAIVAGSPAIELLARLHATCEIHGYVEGPNRAWLAGIIDQGRADNVMRPSMGWEAVAELLRARDDEPVVMSYSVTDWFPDYPLAAAEGTWTPPPDPDDTDAASDAWYLLPEHQQWDLAMAALRRFNERAPLEMRPDVWGRQGFGDPAWSVFDLLAALDNGAKAGLIPEAYWHHVYRDGDEASIVEQHRLLLRLAGEGHPIRNVRLVPSRP